MTKRPIILIGGAPTTGKSTIAAQLSQELLLPVVATDTLREALQQQTTRDALPELFLPEGYDAERFLTEYSAEQIMNIEYAQAAALWSTILRHIDQAIPREQGCILEGISIIPSLVHRYARELPACTPVFLINDDINRIRDIVFTRGIWDDAHTYPDTVKEKEVAWIMLFNQKIEEEAKKYGYPTVEVMKGPDDVAKVREALSI